MKSLAYLFLKRRNVMELFIINYPKEQILSGTDICSQMQITTIVPSINSCRRKGQYCDYDKWWTTKCFCNIAIHFMNSQAVKCRLILQNFRNDIETIR
jgi:hypothetical protein